MKFSYWDSLFLYRDKSRHADRDIPYLLSKGSYVGAAESITVDTFYKNIATDVRIAIIAIAYYNRQWILNRKSVQ